MASTTRSEPLPVLECRECEAEFGMQAIGSCPKCGSRYIKRIEHKRDVLAVNIAEQALDTLQLAEAALRRNGANVPADIVLGSLTALRARLGAL